MAFEAKGNSIRVWPPWGEGVQGRGRESPGANKHGRPPSPARCSTAGAERDQISAWFLTTDQEPTAIWKQNMSRAAESPQAPGPSRRPAPHPDLMAHLLPYREAGRPLLPVAPQPPPLNAHVSALPSMPASLETRLSLPRVLMAPSPPAPAPQLGAACLPLRPSALLLSALPSPPPSSPGPSPQGSPPGQRLGRGCWGEAVRAAST